MEYKMISYDELKPHQTYIVVHFGDEYVATFKGVKNLGYTIAFEFYNLTLKTETFPEGMFTLPCKFYERIDKN